MDLGVRVSMDLREFDSGVAGMNRKLRVVDSEFKATSEAAKKYGDSVSQLKTSMEYLTQKIEIQGQKVNHYKQELNQLSAKQQELKSTSQGLAANVQRLEKEYEQSAQATGKNSEQTKRLKTELDQVKAEYTSNLQQLSRVNKTIDNNTIALNRAEQAHSKLQNELRETNEELNKQTSLFAGAGEKMSAVGNKMQEVGGAIGTSFVAGAGVAGVAVGKLVQFSSELEQSQTKLQKGLGLTTKEAEKMNESVKTVWRDGFGESLEEVSESLVTVRRNMSEIDNGKELEKVTKDAMLLAETFDSDVNEVTRGANQLMVGFGISSTEAMDLLASGAENSLDYSKELFDNVSEYGPLFANMRYSAEEYFEILINGSKNGAYNLDYVNDVMKEFQIRIKDGSKSTSDAMGEMSAETQKVWKSFLEGKATVKDVNNVVLNELKKMENQVEAGRLGVALYGTKWEDLESTTMYSLNEMQGGLGEFKGAMDDIQKAHEETFSVKWQKTLREAQLALEPLGKTFLDMAHEILPAVSSAVQGVSEWFNNLDEGTKKLIATGAVLSIGIMGVVGALGLMTAAVGTLLANPIVLGIVAATGAVAGLGIGLAKLSNDTKKADEDARNFGEGVSEGTKKAASGYVKMRDEAVGALNDLAFSTGEKAKEAVQKAHGEFSKLTDEAIKALEKDKAKFNTFMGKFFGDAADEGTKKLGESIRSAANEYYAQQEEAIRNADQTMHELINTYGNNLFDMSEKDFQRYTAAWQAFDKSTATSVSKSVSELKKVNDAFNKIDKGVSLEQAKKQVVDLTNSTTKTLEQISKARDKDVENAKKYAKQIGLQGKEEAAFIDQVKRKYGEQEVAVRENYFTKMNKIRDVLGAKQSELDFEGQMTKAEKDRFDAFLVGTGSMSSGFEDIYDKNNKFFDKLGDNFDKSVSDMAKYEESVKRYGEALPDSLNHFYDTLQSGGEKAKIATELIAVEMENGVKAIDLGPAGKVKVDEFVSGVQSGTYSVNDISIATINQMRTVLGQQSLTQEGIDTMNSYVNGLRETDSVQEIAKSLKVNLQSEVEIDLGPYGKHTSQSFIEGLKDGTLGIDAVYMYFQSELKKVTQVDLNEEGRQTIATLENGIQSGFLDVNQVLQQFKLDIKSDVKVDVTDEGQFTVRTLAEGLSSGQIDVDTAIQAIKGLVEQGATIDLTEKGKHVPQSQADGMQQNQQLPLGVAGQTKIGIESILGSTTDGGGGPKSMLDLYTGMLNNQVTVNGQANNTKTGVENILGSTTDGGGGSKSGNTFATELALKEGPTKEAAKSVANAATQGMNTVDGATPGLKGGDQFHTSLGAKSGQAKTSGQKLSSGATNGMNTVDGNAPGAKGGNQFYTSIEQRLALTQGAGRKLASGATGGLNTVDGRNPGTKGGMDFTNALGGQGGSAQTSGKKVAGKGKSGLASVSAHSAGMDFVQGFMGGMEKKRSPLESVARGLGNMALGAMKRALGIKSPSRRARDEVGEMVGEGVIIGQDNKIPALKKAAQRMANAAIPKVNPNDLSRATQYLNGSSKYDSSYTTSSNGSYSGARDMFSKEGNVIVNVPAIIVEANGEAIARASYQHVTQLQDGAKRRKSVF